MHGTLTRSASSCLPRDCFVLKAKDKEVFFSASILDIQDQTSKVVYMPSIKRMKRIHIIKDKTLWSLEARFLAGINIINLN